MVTVLLIFRLLQQSSLKEKVSSSVLKKFHDTILFSQITNFQRRDLFKWITQWICTIYFYDAMQHFCLINAQLLEQRAPSAAVL